jgi:hypothetical protein
MQTDYKYQIPNSFCFIFYFFIINLIFCLFNHIFLLFESYRSFTSNWNLFCWSINIIFYNTSINIYGKVTFYQFSLYWTWLSQFIIDILSSNISTSPEDKTFLLKVKMFLLISPTFTNDKFIIKHFTKVRTLDLMLTIIITYIMIQTCKKQGKTYIWILFCMQCSDVEHCLVHLHSVTAFWLRYFYNH